MIIFDFPTKNKLIILALGAESAGNFSIFKKGKIYSSESFGDLSDNKNFNNFKKELLSFIKKEKIKPNLIITDLHPLMETTHLGEMLSKKYKAHHAQVQHHHAHIFASIGDKLVCDTSRKIPSKIYGTCPVIIKQFYGVALDGTGFGMDEKIWGGEVFKLKIKNEKLKITERIGSLENQIMIGGELAIKEPARILIGILSKFLDKNKTYSFVKKYYPKNEFNLIYAQLEQNFNCVETSSTGRILDAASLLLGFCENKRNYKHEAIDLLELNSTKPYRNIKPKIEIVKSSLISNDQYSMLNEFSMTKFSKKYHILNTTFLFEYLIKNITKDRARLAATAQLYIAQGLFEIIKLDSKKESQLFISGGIGKNRIISQYLTAHGAYQNKKIPLGDEGLSFGQIVYYLLSKYDLIRLNLPTKKTAS